MSTRSFVVTDKHPSTHEFKRLAGAYIHWDGYPEGVGVKLATHYTDNDKINRLVELRDVSSLRAEVAPPKGATHTVEKPLEGITVAYGRDDLRVKTEPYLLTDEAAAIKHAGSMWCEYLYVRDESKTSGWRCIDLATDSEVELPLT